MKKFILKPNCLLVVVALALTQTAMSSSTDSVNISVEQKVVELRIKEVETKPLKKARNHRLENLPNYSVCSGAFVSPIGHILTAKHCVENSEYIEVNTFDQQKYKAAIIKTSDIHDLALIRIDKLNSSFFKLARSVERGQTVFVLGSPLSITNTLSQGIIAKLNGDTLLLDCAALPGNSGGPVFNTQQELVGIVTAGYIVYFGTTHLNVAQGLEAILFFLWGIK